MAKRLSPAFAAWVRSAEAAKARARGLALLAQHPRCGARAKSTGEPCRAPAMANGRCRSHGGLVPKGGRWHKPQAPARETPERQERKLRDLAKRAKKREARLAAMTPEERVRHEEWHRTHKPGPAELRKAARERRRQGRDAQALLAATAGREAPSEAEREIARLERLRDAMEAITRRDGVFG